MYDIDTLIKMKYGMVMGHKRARDLFDISFLIHHFSDKFNKKMLYEIKGRMEVLGRDNIKRLFKVDEVVKKFDAEKIIDSIVNNIRTQ